MPRNAARRLGRVRPIALTPMLLVLAAHAAAADRCEVSNVIVAVPDGRAELVGIGIQPATAQTRLTAVVRHASAAQQAAATPATGAAAPRGRPAAPPPRPRPQNDQQRLFYAIVDGDLTAVSRLLHSGQVDVNAPEGTGAERKPIEVAAMRAQPQIARALIAHGALVRGTVGTEEVRPVALVMLNLMTTVEFHGNPAAFVYASERSPQDFAATLEVLLDAGADADGLLDPTHPKSALAVLVSTPHFEGDTRLARMLIEHGARLGDDAPGGSPLIAAAAAGRGDIVDLAVDGGHLEGPALDAALAALVALHDDERIARVLAAGASPDLKVRGQPLLCTALEDVAGGQSLARQLLARGAHPNIDCRAGPPLLLAAADDELATLLLTHGADPNRANARGERILDRVPDTDHALLDAILARGGTPGLSDDEARQVELWQAGKPGPLVRSILHHKDYLAASLLKRDGLGTDSACTAVLYATASGTGTTLRELLRRGGDPDATSARGITALMIAAHQGDEATLALLLADPRARADRTTPTVINSGHFALYSEDPPPLRTGGRSALMYAAAAGCTGCVRLLLQHGASARATDAEGWNALRYARAPETRAALGGTP